MNNYVVLDLFLFPAISSCLDVLIVSPKYPSSPCFFSPYRAYPSLSLPFQLRPISAGHCQPIYAQDLCLFSPFGCKYLCSSCIHFGFVRIF